MPSGTVGFTCSFCLNQVGPIDVSSFRNSLVVTQPVHCPQCSKETTIKVSNGEIVDLTPEPSDASDIDQYVDVPDHIKDAVNEAYVCKNRSVGRAGACIVRVVLDELLYALGCDQERPLGKVNRLEERCKNEPAFELEHRPLCRRIDIFKTIAGLAGYYAHGQKKVADVSLGEFELYLRAVESAVKDKWPARL